VSRSYTSSPPQRLQGVYRDYFTIFSSVCGTIRINRGLLRDMTEEAKMLKKVEVSFRRKQNVLLLSHRDKRLVNMVSNRHTAAIIEDTSR
jgi:hypothetical protein